MIKILHTADIHLGAGFKFLGEFGSHVRSAVRGSLSAMAELAKSERVDVVLISGDLFDSNSVSLPLVQFAVGELERLSPTPVCIIPGTHDCLDEGSVYHRKEFSGDSSNIYVFKEGKPETKVLDEIGLAVHAKANLSNEGQDSPLLGLKPKDTLPFNVTLVHGSVKIEGKYSPNDFPIDRQEIRESGMDYIACGHWHKCLEFSEDKTVAFYSGSPETMRFEDAPDSGFVLIVELQDSPPRVEKRRLGKYSWEKVTSDLSLYPTNELLLKHLRAFRGRNKLLKVLLSGLVSPDADLDFDMLEADLKSDFAFLDLRTDNIHMAALDKPETTFPKGTIGYNFERLLQKQIDEAASPRKRLLEDALVRGRALLSGRVEANS